MSYQGGGRIVIGGNPGMLAKNAPALRYVGARGVCGACGKPRGRAVVLRAKLPKAVSNDIEAAAFEADLKPILGPAAVAVIAHWPTKWGKAGRCDGRPRGDVDAPLSGLLDALAGTLYGDDAQVAVLVAANAYDAARPRIEVVARPLSPALLAALAAELGLPFDTARLTLGQQEALL